MEKITQLDSPDILTPEGDLKDPYRGFIAKSKYNRWLEEEGRRETWVESVNRYVDWMVDYQKKRGVDTPKDLVEDIRHAITYQHVMPSMRALMTAGPALEKNHIAGYNCSLITVDSIRAFDEALVILMHGTGLGFSVENKYVDKLPEVAESFHATNTVVKVEDSKEGWAKALKEWLALLWSGQIPAYDVSKVRPKGARLKTFGGRASGPEPLVDLFEFTKKLLMNAAGRRITNLEAHDIMCKVAEIVVVGGVRRCLVATTKVQTPFGWTNISDLQVGDFIVRGGETAEVLAKVNSGVQDTLKVSYGIGNSITMTPNHRVAVFDSVDSYIFKEASELEVGDRLVWDLAGYDGEDQDLPQSEYKDHFNAKPVAIPSKVTTDIAWLIGQIHGDGYVGPKTLEISSNDNEFEYMERAQSILKSAFGLDSTVARDSHGGRGIRLRANSRKLALWLSSHVKTSNSPIAIPDFIVKSSREVRAAYLAGLLDSDGRITSDGVIEQATTVYPSYAKDLQALLSGLGIFSMAYTGSAQKRRDDGVQAQDYVTVKISNLTSRLEYTRLVGPHSLTLDDVELTPSAQARDFSYPADFGVGYRNRATRRSSLIDREALNPDYRYAPVIITDIEYGGKHEVWDIEISSINEFTADGIVSHNSALISLSDLGSRDMAEAKAGAWWVNNPQRALANNSAVYTKHPNMETFFREWKNLYDSKSGERGIFNLDAVRKHIDKTGRRDSSLVAGTNPSLIAGTRVYTTEGVKNIEDLENTEFQVRNLYGNISKATCWKSGVDEEVLKLNIKGGHSHTATPKHKWPVWDGETWVKRRTDQLKPGDKIPNLISYEMFPDGDKGTYDDGFIVGWNLGDGWQTYRPKGLQIGFIVGPEDREQGIDKKLEGILSKLGSSANFQGKDEIHVNNSALRKLFATYGVKHKTEGLPTAVWDSTVSDDFRRGVIDGLFSADGSIDIEQRRIHFSQSSDKMIRDIASLLGFFGVKTTTRTVSASAGKAFPQKYVGEARNKVFTSTVLRIGEHANVQVFSDNFTLSHHRKQRDLQAILDAPRKRNVRPTNWYLEVVSIEDAGTADVWDISVFDDTHAFQLNHGVSGNCGEINLRDKEFCNLTEVILAGTDTKNEILEKIRIATILGTWQASLTDFKYLRKKWADNVREEALLGVSMTGIFGNQLMNGHEGLESLAQLLDEAREFSVVVNKEEAARIGINQAAAISCCKPSGTVSQLTGTSSGIHPWYAHKYARRVRGNNHDPLVRLMKDAGVPNEPELNKPLDTTVFTFPLQAPEGSVVGDDITAIEHLELWRTYRNHWTEHNPSVTITVREDEWLEVGAYVYKHFDEMSGVSFLPDAGNHTYQQAPFEKLDDEAFQALVDSSVPIPWDKLGIYEMEDATTGSQELACVAGACEVVDLETTDSETIEFTEVPIIDLEEVK